MRTIEDAKKALRRAGNHTIQRFLEKDGEMISGSAALAMTNYYGLDPYAVFFIAESHDRIIDEKEYIELLEEQDARHKRMKPCVGSKT